MFLDIFMIYHLEAGRRAAGPDAAGAADGQHVRGLQGSLERRNEQLHMYMYRYRL